MMTIIFRVGYLSGETEDIVLRDKRCDLTKALQLAREPLGNGQERDIDYIEFVGCFCD